jgi:hypothetical protein
MSKTQNDETVSEDDGLTNAEREYLTVPMAQMDETQRRTAIMVREKRDNFIWAENAKARIEEKKKNELADTAQS